MSSHHHWKFFRAGGFDQVRLATGADLLALDQLDQKLWVALACPTAGLEFDARTLALIDTDQDGRIRAPELIAAVKWVGGLLKNSDDLLKSSPSLPLSAINDATPEGKQLLASARHILATLKKTADAVTLDDTTALAEKLVETTFNGDGIIVQESAADGALKAAIRDLIACLGPETDRSGKPGLSQPKLEQFFAEAQAYSAWWKQAEADAAILPLGEATVPAAAAVRAVKSKLDDYFTRCQLAAFDPRSLNALNREEKEYLVFTAKDLTVNAAEIAGLPLARIEASRPLPLKEGVNPAWTGPLAKFQSLALKPLLGDKSSLTQADWTALLAKLGPFEWWWADKVGAVVEPLGLKRVRELLAGEAKQKLA